MFKQIVKGIRAINDRIRKLKKHQKDLDQHYEDVVELIAVVKNLNPENCEKINGLIISDFKVIKNGLECDILKAVDNQDGYYIIKFKEPIDDWIHGNWKNN
jgi:archaellum component FlaC